jgi:hypothetical protein
MARAYGSSFVGMEPFPIIGSPVESSAAIMGHS